MTLRIIEGFDAYADSLSTFPGSGNARMTAGTVPAECKLAAANSRWGVGKAWRLNTTALDTSLTAIPAFAFNVGTAQADDDHVVVGFAFKLDAGAGAVTIPLLSLVSALGGQVMGLYITAIGYIALMGGHGVSHDGITPPLVTTSSTYPIAAGEWAWIEAELFVEDDGTGAICKVWVNGNLVMDYAAGGEFPNADSGSSPMVWTWTDVVLGTCVDGQNNDFWQMRGPWAIDDFYMILKDATSPNARLGDARVDTIYPTSETSGQNTGYARTGGADIAAAIGQGSNDGDTSYYEADAVDDKVLFDSTGTMSGNPTTIHGVGVAHISRKTLADDRLVRPLIRQSTTNYEGDASALASSYSQHRHVWVTQPNGGGAWTKTTVEAAAFGVTIES